MWFCQRTGGGIYIGKNDDGIVVGVQDYKKPNIKN